MSDEEVKDLIMKYISKINGEIKNHAFDLAKEFACKNNLDQNNIHIRELISDFLLRLCVHFSNTFVFSTATLPGVNIESCMKDLLDSISSQFDELSKKPTQKH